MRILVHDYAGHPFQVELSRELAHRGHDVVHSWCEAYESGKGELAARPGETLRFASIGGGLSIAKLRFRRRVFQEVRLGLQLARQARAERPDVVMVANVPVPTLVVLAAVMLVSRIPWVLWHQDVQCVAIKSFAGAALSRFFLVVGQLIGYAERWCSRRAAAVVVIAESFLDIHRSWRTDAKAVVIPNWAPLDEIVPVARDNAWAREQGVDRVQTLLYSGTLGLKHNPALLPQLARAVSDLGTPVRLVVVNEGPAAPVLAAEAERLGVDLQLLPFQPYEQLPYVLGAGDVLVVLLEQTAGAFSVPSKTLSYLSSGRPVLGLMPEENAASGLVARAGGCVLPPAEHSLEAAAAWVHTVLGDPETATLLGKQARALAEEEFALARCADRFEAVLADAAARRAPRAEPAPAMVPSRILDAESAA
ncbi:MAG: glycosyltransferase family 4 protein [Marmoricola sp.]